MLGRMQKQGTWRKPYALPVSLFTRAAPKVIAVEAPHKNTLRPAIFQPFHALLYSCIPGATTGAFAHLCLPLHFPQQ